MPEFEHNHSGHNQYPEKRLNPPNIVCPSGKAYYVCATGSFKGCCSADPCSTGYCRDYPHDLAWTPSTATQIQAQTIGSYTTTVTMTLSSITTDIAVTSTMSRSNSDSPLVSSLLSEISASSSITLPRSSDSTVKAQPDNTIHTSSSTTDPFLSTNTVAPHSSVAASSPHVGIVAGIALGSAAVIALLLLVCCICLRRRKKKSGWSFTYDKKEEDKELKQQLKEAAAIQAERNKALRALENRRTGVGADDAWPASPKYSTGFPGIRRDA